jgi:4-hydroxybenzoate polyprenyltransferase
MLIIFKLLYNINAYQFLLLVMIMPYVITKSYTAYFGKKFTHSKNHVIYVYFTLLFLFGGGGGGISNTLLFFLRCRQHFTTSLIVK